MTNEPRQSRPVLITGTSTGLGLDMALYLAERGFKVYATMRNTADRTQLDTLAAERQLSLHVLQLDITDEASITAAVDAIIAENGTLFALVNNAGSGLRGYFEDLEIEEIRRLFDVNVMGTMKVTKAVLPHMRAAGSGRIIIITSVAGRIASMGLSSYCATKFAQEGFGESLAQELSPFGISVSIVEPAIIKTERWTTNRGIARHAENPSSPYHYMFKASEAAADRLVATSPTRKSDVSQTIYRVLTVPRPKLRYVVGRRAGFALGLRRRLPGQLFERLYFGFAVRAVTRRARELAAEQSAEVETGQG